MDIKEEASVNRLMLPFVKLNCKNTTRKHDYIVGLLSFSKCAP